jgi:uncharacterized LabA/DUF88 family protein
MALAASPITQWSDRPRSVSLIDGAWLEIARRGQVSDPKWSLLDFATAITPRYHWRFRTYYFDALPYKERNAPSPSHVARYDQKSAQLQKIERLERFTVRRGYCTQQPVSGYLQGGGTQSTMTTVVTIQQKMVDVLLAVEMTRIAWSKEALHISLVGGDGDYVAAVRAAKEAGAIVRLYSVKTQSASVADALFDVLDERLDLQPVFKSMENKLAPPKV